MYLIRDIFYLHFGHYKEAKALLDQAQQQALFQSQGTHRRFLTDFTGTSYQLILEEQFDTLAAYEAGLTKELASLGWQQWYAEFKTYVGSSEREILKIVS